MTLIPELRNIIFDLGGVLLNIEPEKTVNKLLTFTSLSREILMQKFSQNNVYSDFDKGIKSPEQFRNDIRRLLEHDLPDEVIDETWNELLLDFPETRVKLLQDLRNSYRLFLLSNTNVIHFQCYTRQFLKTYHFPMSDLFEKMYLTFEMGMRKPDPEAFGYVLKNSHLLPEETLFVDDSKDNIETAAALGLKVCQVTEDTDVVDLLAEFRL